MRAAYDLYAETNPAFVSFLLYRFVKSHSDGGGEALNRPLFAGDPEVRILGYGKEQMWKQIFT